MGLGTSANHLDALPEGQEVVAACRPVHIGCSTQVWATEIRRADGGPCCSSRLTCAVLDS